MMRVYIAVCLFMSLAAFVEPAPQVSLTPVQQQLLDMSKKLRQLKQERGIFGFPGLENLMSYSAFYYCVFKECLGEEKRCKEDISKLIQAVAASDYSTIHPYSEAQDVIECIMDSGVADREYEILVDLANLLDD